MLCICAVVASTICSGHPNASAAAAIFSITCSVFFSLLLTISTRQADIASKAAFTALRASSESPEANIGLKARGFVSVNLFCMTAFPPTGRMELLGSRIIAVSQPSDERNGRRPHERDAHGGSSAYRLLGAKRGSGSV